MLSKLNFQPSFSAVTFKSPLRFGAAAKSQDSQHLTLPHWAQQVPDPAITFPHFYQELDHFTQHLQGQNKIGVFAKLRQGFKLFRMFRKLNRELQGNRYLPDNVQKEL